MSIGAAIIFLGWFAFWIVLSVWSNAHGPLDRADRKRYIAMRKESGL